METVTETLEPIHHVTRYGRVISCGATGRVRVEEFAKDVTCEDCKAADDQHLIDNAHEQAIEEDAERDAAEPVMIVDRTGSGRRHTILAVEPGQIPGKWPVRVAVAVGYDPGLSLHLSKDEALALVDAVRALVGPDPRIAALEADVARYRGYFEEDERLIEKLSDQLARYQAGAA